MGRGPDARIIDESPQRNMNEDAVADNRIQQRTTLNTADIVGIFFTEDKQILRTLRDVQLAALDADKGLERGTRRPTAVRAVAVQRVDELVSDGVSDGTAQALSGERTTRICFGRIHEAYPFVLNMRRFQLVLQKTAISGSKKPLNDIFPLQSAHTCPARGSRYISADDRYIYACRTEPAAD
jgi:hypothetical protein